MKKVENFDAFYRRVQSSVQNNVFFKGQASYNFKAYEF